MKVNRQEANVLFNQAETLNAETQKVSLPGIANASDSLEQGKVRENLVQFIAELPDAGVWFRSLQITGIQELEEGPDKKVREGVEPVDAPINSKLPESD
jgi:hypothetical protein